MKNGNCIFRKYKCSHRIILKLHVFPGAGYRESQKKKKTTAKKQSTGGGDKKSSTPQGTGNVVEVEEVEISDSEGDS